MSTTITNATLLLWRGAELDVQRGAVQFANGRIVSVTTGEQGGSAPSDEVIDAHGALLTPGLIDCHTHALFMGSRAHEFALRARGATYQDIAAQGGGIASTRAATAAASDEALRAQLTQHLEEMLRGGTTAVEVKSGYDLTADGELRMLTAIAGVARARTQLVVPTALCHVVPAERLADREHYVNELVRDFVPRLPGLATSLDIYADQGAFTLAEARLLLRAARHVGLPVRAHAGQFVDVGAAELVAELGGLSIDHVEQISASGIGAVAAAGVVAVMLPGACVQLRLPVPPVAELRKAGVRMALATDFNPGSSCGATLPIQMWLACTHFGMSVDEAWLGVTRHAAAALGRTDIGDLKVGARADLCLWDTDEPADLPYRYGRAWQPTVWAHGVRC